MKTKLLKYKILQFLPGRVGKRYELKHLHRHLYEITRIRALDSPPFAVFAHEYIGREIIIHGWYESVLINFLEKHIFPLISRNSIALDIGANIGNHSNRFANYFNSVHAFEPNKRTYHLLQANAMLTPGKIICHNVGCSDSNFSQAVNFSSISVGQASLEADSSLFHDGIGKQTANFKLVKLDEYLPSKHHAKVGFMKIDVEGHEKRALKGAEKIICASKPIIAFEANDPENAPYKYLTGLGYQHFYGFEKVKKSFRMLKRSRLVEVINSNKSNIEPDMVIASLTRLEHGRV
ncbi:MAG: FkbM family methyltransferase [Aestuariivita sp.]|nr:FkbM family methyltransferase [Aestuariivita sp.]